MNLGPLGDSIRGAKLQRLRRPVDEHDLVHDPRRQLLAYAALRNQYVPHLPRPCGQANVLGPALRPSPLSIVAGGDHGIRRIEPALAVTLSTTLDQLWRGRGDPCTQRDADGSWWRALATPEGPATLRLSADAGAVLAESWGPGSAWALDVAPDLIGAADDLTGFSPSGVLARLLRQHPGARIIRSRAVWHALLIAVLEQKVPGKQAARAYAALTRAFGPPAPGPRELRLPPPAAAIARLPYFELSRFGIERRRGETLIRLARNAPRLEALIDEKPARARQVLESFAGVGPWTSAEVTRVALGDADALSLGDYNLPNLVAFNLTGEPRGDERQMLELLSPFAGHRGRAQRLLEVGGKPPPRFGPRRPLAGWHRQRRPGV